MPDIIGLVFEYINDIHYATNTGQLELAIGDVVIARTVRSKEIGRVIQLRDSLPARCEKDPFVRRVLRKATEKDFQREESNRDRERKALSIATKKIRKLGLDMTLIRVHYLFDHSRILFYFKAAGKVDFRQLVRELASVFKARIELRQIGVRDEAKMLGGLATCGRELCCSTWLRSFSPVTVRMAKDQHLSLNPNKISGLCGRLQCCLEYEQPFYEEALKKVPHMGSYVEVPEGRGRLIKANIFSGIATIILDDSSIVTAPLIEVRRKPRSTSREKNTSHDHEDKSESPPISTDELPHLVDEETLNDLESLDDPTDLDIKVNRSSPITPSEPTERSANSSRDSRRRGRRRTRRKKRTDSDTQHDSESPS